LLALYEQIITRNFVLNINGLMQITALVANAKPAKRCLWVFARRAICVFP